MNSIAYAAVAVLAIAPGASAQINSAEAARLAEAAKVVQEIRGTIPREYWDKAHCAAVIPDLKKAAFIFGGEYGKGVMSCRTSDGWSAPLLLQLAKGSWGFQAGAEQVDVVMLMMNENGVDKLLKNRVTLGADASIAAGPLGRQGHIGTDAFLQSEILAYSRAQGLFAGVDLSGGVLRPDEDANKRAYGPNFEPKAILASRDIAAPPEAAPFLRALEVGPLTKSAAPQTSSPSAPKPRSPSSPQPSVAAPAPTTDSDARTRLVDMQQTLDRLLSQDNRSAVGTSGTGDSTITVDRAQLEMLRRQIEGALSTLDRR